ncbi:hypothetical protein [Azospirillum sp.]|uniref:hypothetical protein n=1 Tax=Azospirillum sp. TaxID=34012 RepID=UPI003D732771
MTMRVRITQLDKKLKVPNLALMRIAHWHRAQGHEVVFRTSPVRDMLDGHYDRVYGSAIFGDASSAIVTFLKPENFPDAIVGGTGTGNALTVEQALGLGVESYDHHDYSIYPKFKASIGFTQRGCRLKCGFCVVPWKEGAARSTSTISDIWRGGDHQKRVILLDNDFFGQPARDWEDRVVEVVCGGFKVCINQGVNLRKLHFHEAEALACMPLYDDGFTRRRIYTAWDDPGHESAFFRGVEHLVKAGVNLNVLFVYMLVGYSPAETWETVFRRFNKMATLGMRPYPMVYGDENRTMPLGGHNAPIGHFTLGDFQRWAIRASKLGIPFAEYDPSAKGCANKGQTDLFVGAAA